ncbi:hypothetical protein PICMEDRAFT_71956 [Pichia membranifaciens NRRL Y-2026]|uniref:L-2-hydroxyglutarate dehydrogenase, mitochondrial n=1 Tax=Pichia membranifaciens NRRL Y-2026 TaxID=763406 RepID=A0A1E3NPJ4_9ASCO|nr:hypothetical protein PICMEDRAFT_71956 [Pichia membranifaciens NRRL Y-2026]ODQ47952.1 hypothetical protein PICMEDRAFT_71956 [Pichia membranifaciens NRRL Y-2026]
MLVSRRSFSAARAVRAADFTHTIIGGGVVGLAIGAELVQHDRRNKVLILEKNAEYGQETSSRNSEVVHAGLYYPPDSLKTRLCIRGKEKIYEQRAHIPVQQCGKWIIAQNGHEQAYLEKLHAKAQQIGVPTEFVPLAQARTQEPFVRARYAVLNSPTTGITSAHGLMDYLYTRFQDGDGSLALGTEVVAIERLPGENVYEIRTRSADTAGTAASSDTEDFSIKSTSVINCAGLHAPAVANMVLPPERHVHAFYAKGNYFSYSGPNTHVRRLIYPCPTPGVASLGTHLTLDLGGQIRFGPDLEWVPGCSDYRVNEHNLDAAVDAVKVYLPHMRREYLSGSYSGIRPKLAGPDSTAFQDFVIRSEVDAGLDGFVNLLGIESPGLTASMGIAEYVVEKFFR